jgi:RimJ/RimL family protein N-acetyltransferase
MAWLTPEYGWTAARTWVIEAMRTWDGGTACEFLIRDREDGQIAGSCGLNSINRKDMVCNLGYWVRAAKLRLGAATQATLLLRDFGFRVLKLNRIEIVVATSNLPSQRVAEKVGATCEGIQQQRIRVDQQVHDARMYALLRGL